LGQERVTGVGAPATVVVTRGATVDVVAPVVGAAAVRGTTVEVVDGTVAATTVVDVVEVVDVVNSVVGEPTSDRVETEVVSDSSG